MIGVIHRGPASRSRSVVTPDGEVQPIARPGRIRLACGRDETGDMRFLLDHLAAVVAADVARDVLHAGDHQDGRGTREQRQRADRPIVLLRMRACMRDLIPPAAKLGVQIVDIDKRARRKEGVAQVLKREIAGDVASRRLIARKRSGGFSTCADPAGAGLFEIRQLGSRQPKPYRARCSWLTDDESAGRLDHLMHDRWRDSEESAAGRRFASGVVVYDGASATRFGDDLFAVPLRFLWGQS
jgi:hypothetical protein